jgi:RsiW-degrading membrane proteinase PrsW (M82 family)
MFVYLTIAGCAIAIVLLVCRYDMYDREPPQWLAAAVLLGAAGCWLAGTIEDQLIGWTSAQQDLAWQAAFASGVEELIKLLGVLLIAVVARRHFNDPLDGLIYGAMIGLGLALAESMFYVSMSAGETELIGTEAVRLLLHMMLGGLDGFSLGMARFRMRYWIRALLFTLGASLLIHFAWDRYCGLPAPAVAAAWPARMIAVALMLSACLLFGIAVVVGTRWSQQQLGRGQPRRLWGWPFSLLWGDAGE